MKYDDEHVPKSPRMVQVDPQCEAAKKVTIHGLRDRGLEVSDPKRPMHMLRKIGFWTRWRRYDEV